MEDNQNLTPDNDPRLIEALRGLNSLDASTPDELTRRRHLAQMRRARSGARVQRLVGVAAALALLAGGFAVARGGSSNNSSNTPAAQEDVELPELRPVTDLTPVPFERTEQYVILDVSAKRASAVSQELSAALGSEPAVVGKDKSSTTFVVPASAVSKLSDTSGITATADSPVKSTAEQTPVPSWGLDRIDATDVALNNSYKYVSTGTSSYVYVIDTGVYSGHSDLSGRVTPGYSAVSDGNGSEDCNGHGTHVAGTIAGTKYGVAKSTRVVAVRVLDCNGSGYSSSVVAGINWVVQSHPGGSGIINMSLGGGANSAIDTAVADATAAGLTVVVAAGNSSADACSYSPARAPSAITIGAIDRTDARASYSNFGSCVDVWAPGTGITSSWIGGASATNTISGTSMASPHVAGLAARLAQAFPGISNSEIVSKLTANSTTALPVTTFVEQEVPVTTTTAPDIATTTVPEGTTTTTAAPVVTVAPTTTTTAPAPTTTTTVKPIKRPVKKREIVQPKNFSLRSKIESNTLVVTAAWFDDRSPESYRVECINKRNNKFSEDTNEAELTSESLKFPVDTVINVERNAVTTAPNGRAETKLTITPPVNSLCWIVAVVGGETGPRSNVAVTPRSVRITPTPTTTTTTTTTTVAPTTTTTVVSTPTTVPPSSSMPPVNETSTTAPAGPTTTVANARTQTTTTAPRVPTTPPKKTTGKK